jgi:hypothetical protein
MTLSSTSMGWAAIVALAVGASQLIVAQDNAPVALQLQQRYGREHNERLSSCSLAIASLFSDTRARLLCTPRDGAGPLVASRNFTAAESRELVELTIRAAICGDNNGMTMTGEPDGWPEHTLTTTCTHGPRVFLDVTEDAFRLDSSRVALVKHLLQWQEELRRGLRPVQ